MFLLIFAFLLYNLILLLTPVIEIDNQNLKNEFDNALRSHLLSQEHGVIILQHIASERKVGLEHNHPHTTTHIHTHCNQLLQIL